MSNLNKYIAYSEKDRKYGLINIRYIGLARDKEHFKELANKGKFDLTDYTIELVENNVSKSIEDNKAYIKDAFYDNTIEE